MRFPAAIAALVGELPFREEGIGMSAARVYLFEDYVLKVSPAAPHAVREAQILSWLEKAGLPAPRPAAYAEADGQVWLLMTRIRGQMLCDPAVMNRPALLLDCLAEGLHALWSADIGDCPFTRTWADELDEAERSIRAGRFNPDNCEPETFGPGGFESPMALLDWLRKNTPPEERVLSHGDFCLPNLFTDGRRLSGMIDLGDCGIADPWRDLSLAWRSLKHNSDGHYGKVYPVDPDDLFRAAGVVKDPERLRYYLLLDELF